MKDYFEREAELSDYSLLDKATLHHEQRRTEIIMELADLKNTIGLLDYGCGDGLQLEAIHKKHPLVFLSGYDISEIRVKRASQRNPAADFYTTLPEPAELWLWDKIICSEVLEHQADPQQIMDDIYKRLHKGGKAIISVPYAQKLNWIQCPKCGEMITDGHIQSFNEYDLKMLFYRAGFRNIYVKGYRVVRFPFIEDYLPYFWWKQLLKVFYRKVRPYYLIGVGQK